MKKSLLLFALLLSATLYTHASHLMGGQITARQLDSLKYEVTLTVYRDVNGIAVSTTAVLVYDSLPSNTNVLSRTVPVSPANNILNGVEEYTYTDTISFPGDGQYRIWYTNCCRNGAISNMSNPLSDNIYLYTIVTVGAGYLNSTPVMLNRPITLATVMQPLIYNPLPYDADGDSIAWTMDVPWTADNTPCAGYTLPAADVSGPFTLNSYTGEIDWTPSTQGNWNATVLVKEYRNGVQIGEIRRDMQIPTIVDTTNGNRLAFTGTPPLQPNSKGYYEYVIPPNMPFHLIINANDPGGDSLIINATGGTFEKTVNPSTASTTSAAGHAQATFDWTPGTPDVSGKPYIDVFRGSKYHGTHVFMTDLTVAITVSTTTAVTGPLSTPFNLSAYPNPVADQLIIEANAPQETSAQINLCDLSGRIVTTVIDGTIHTGKTLMAISTKGLPAGVYMLSGICGSEKISNHKVVVE